MSASGPADRRALDAILERAATDREFRQRLLTDWRNAIREGFGIVVPPGFTMRFLERDPGVDALVVLPDLRQNGDELSDQELDSIAGGVEGADLSVWAEPEDGAPW